MNICVKQKQTYRQSMLLPLKGAQREAVTSSLGWDRLPSGQRGESSGLHSGTVVGSAVKPFHGFQEQRNLLMKKLSWSVLTANQKGPEDASDKNFGEMVMSQSPLLMKNLWNESSQIISYSWYYQNIWQQIISKFRAWCSLWVYILLLTIPVFCKSRL